MGANTIGTNFCVTTCGESHGEALACIVDGVPPQIAISSDLIQADLDRRRPGSTAYGTPRNEGDRVRIISGIFEGQTTGTPIGLIIENTSQRSQDYNDIKNVYRPSHADYTYMHKYGIRDYRGGGRSSARETAMRVAAGAIAKKVLLDLFNIRIEGAVIAIGAIEAEAFDSQFALTNAFNFADANKLHELQKYMDKLIAEHNSVGAKIKIRACNVPVGWGSPIFDRLDANIAHAMMSINAVKAVEIGDGFELCALKGTEARDEMSAQGFLSNHSGGITGGISTGQDIEVTIGLKPTSSILIEGRSIDKDGNDIKMVTKGRHDPCVGIRAVVIAESMLAITLLDAALMHKGQCFNVVDNNFRIK